MNPNSTIKIKAISEPIIVSKASALEVQKIFENKNIDKDFVIRIGNKSFIKGDIKFISIENDGADSRRFDQAMRDSYIEEKTRRNELVRQAPEYKSRLLDMFIETFKISADRLPTTEEIQKAHIVQLDFFKKNPRRTLCDFDLLTALIPKSESDGYLLGSQWRMHLKICFINFIRNAINRDMQLSR